MSTSIDVRTDEAVQFLTLTLDGITAGDYLASVRDPEPPALERDLREVAVRADPLGDTIEVALSWTSTAPGPRAAARAAGFPLIPEVVAVGEPRRSLDRRRDRRLGPRGACCRLNRRAARSPAPAPRPAAIGC